MWVQDKKLLGNRFKKQVIRVMERKLNLKYSFGGVKRGIDASRNKRGLIIIILSLLGGKKLLAL